MQNISIILFYFFISVFIFISIIYIYIYNVHTVLYLNLCAIPHEHHFLQTYHMICSTDLQHSPLILIHYISLMSAVLHSVSEETSSSGGRWRDWQIERKRWSKRKRERAAESSRDVDKHADADLHILGSCHGDSTASLAWLLFVMFVWECVPVCVCVCVCVCAVTLCS